MDLLSIKPTVSKPSLSSLWSLHVQLQSETQDADLRSTSQASLPTPLLTNSSNNTTLRSVKSLSDLSQTYRLDLSVGNIHDENCLATQLTDQFQITSKQRYRCVFEWLESVEMKKYLLPTN